MKVSTAALRRHPFRAMSLVAVVLLGAGAFVARDVIRVAVTPESPHDLTLPQLASMTARDGETVYRIDASRSEAKVEVGEILAGSEKKVELSTKVMGGEVAIAGGDALAVRFGELVVNVGELRSDNALRDKMLRHEFLESHNFPMVRLLDASVAMPEDASPANVNGATLKGDLEVKGKTHPTTWNVDARTVDSELLVTATADVKMSDLDVGPITKVGLVRTSNDMKLRLDLVAVDATKYTPPVKLATNFVGAESDTTGPSFSSEIAPILSENCASCHKRGAIGASMWALDVANDAAEIADGLAVVTGAGYMPPWPASDAGVPLKHARGLDADQIRAIADWAGAGGKLDVDPTTRVLPPKEPDVRLPRPDRVIKLAEPYKGSPDKRDDYRCFILDPQITEPSMMTAYTFDPDRLEVVHHAIVYHVAAGAMRDHAESLDAMDKGSGWSCFTGMGANAGPQIAGWVPGQRPNVAPEGSGFALQPGDVLVAQIHYHLDYAAPADRSGMTLELADDPTGLVALQPTQMVAPVEIPCPAGSTGPLCDRDASLVDITNRFGSGATMTANGLHRLCGTTPEEVAAASDGTTATTTCDYGVRQSGQVVSFLGHMHEIGSSYRMTLNPDTPEAKVLLDIPVWNFSWQMDYEPADEIIVNRGDTIRVTCNWDRRMRFDPVPRYIVFADGTQDEMCFSTLTVRPGPGD